MPDYDQDSFDNTRQAVLTLAAGVSSADTMFGTKADVNPVHHLLGTAAGWGGLPAKEATYLVVNAGLPVGRYELDVGDDVPVDAFWSISVYNADGFFEPNPSGVYSVNSITGVRDPDGAITVRFGDHGPDRPTAPDHRGLELRSPALSATFRGPRRHLDVPQHHSQLINDGTRKHGRRSECPLRARSLSSTERPSSALGRFDHRCPSASRGGCRALMASATVAYRSRSRSPAVRTMSRTCPIPWAIARWYAAAVEFVGELVRAPYTR